MYQAHKIVNVSKTLRNKSQIFLVQKARKLESSEKYFMGSFTELDKKSVDFQYAIDRAKNRGTLPQQR